MDLYDWVPYIVWLLWVMQMTCNRWKHVIGIVHACDFLLVLQSSVELLLMGTSRSIFQIGAIHVACFLVYSVNRITDPNSHYNVLCWLCFTLFKLAALLPGAFCIWIGRVEKRKILIQFALGTVSHQVIIMAVKLMILIVFRPRHCKMKLTTNHFW